MSTTVRKEKLEALVSRRNKYYERMEKLHSYLANLSEANTSSFLVRFERIEDLYRIYDGIQDEIDTLCAQMDDEDKVNTMESMSKFEDMYYEIRAFVRNSNLNPQAPVTTGTSTSPNTAPVPAPVIVHPRLPKLEVPTFSGDLKQWSNFHSLFTSTIHRRTDISEVEKLQYLRSFLRGPALSLIENFQLLDANYTTAYRLLCSRYENKRILAAHHLNSILNFKPLLNSNVSGLKAFLEVFQTNIAALKNLALPDLGDFLMLQIALRSLHVDQKRMFEDKCGAEEIPTYGQLMTYINKLCLDSEMVNYSTCHISKPSYSVTQSSDHTAKPPQKLFTQRHTYLSTSINDSHPPRNNSKNNQVTSNPANNIQSVPQVPQSSCPLCKQYHPLFKCSKFISLDVPKRFELVKTNNRCINCLGSHRFSECRSNSSCQTCLKKHHTLIHRDSFFPSHAPREENPSTSKNFSGHASINKNLQNTTVILGTAKATIFDSFGYPHPIRIVVDPGSQLSIISEDCVQRIGLPKHKCNVSISGIGDNTVPENNGAVYCTLSTYKPSSVNLQTEAIVLKRISSLLPSVPISSTVLSKFAHLDLADPKFSEPGVVDFLLGAELYAQILCTHGNNVISGTPTAMKTTLGWIVFGRAPTVHEVTSRHSLFVNSSPSLDSVLQKFWETEEVSVKQIQDPEDVKCEEHFLSTHQRDESGRYIVSLPFRESPSNLGDNRAQAINHYNRLEKRLAKNTELKEEYDKFFLDYVSQDHMSICDSPSRYIIPHREVLKVSTTTKVRGVFNASASSSTHNSLNDLLMKGPKLQKDICSIILSFCAHRVVVCADIKQMYRQILLHPDDRKYQHIILRNPATNQITEYELKTVTYGISPSAFQAQRVLQQLVHDEGQDFKLASNAILAHTYIDDIVSGGATEEEALALQQELISLLKRGGFELRKWASNNPAILQSVPHDHCEKPLSLREDEEPTFKILGLHWDPASDTFSYHVSKIDIVFTKRSILSHIARMYDPLGWLSPVIFWAKYLLQVLWLSQYSWDAPISPELRESWSSFASQLPLLETVKISRYIDVQDSVHIVGFCDASERGYAAVIYLVSAGSVHILKAKSRVAPTKAPLSVPRLELNGSLVLARLYDSLKSYLSNLKVASVTFYSDSNIVLAWIKTPPHTLKTYVANRIVEINNLIPESCSWYHVPTELNPADCASRGLLPDQFVNYSLWLHGPEFLRSPPDTWPRTQGNQIESLPLPEVKTNTNALLTNSPPCKPYLLQVCEKYSQFSKLQRVFAYVLRFVANTRRAKEQREFGPLSVSELRTGILTITKFEQQFHFHNVISALETSGKITSSAILKLTPFVDKHGNLRVGGRLRNSKNLSQDSMHPLLLPKHCHLSNLLCDYYHVYSLHAGPRTVQALIQQKFWILSLRDLLRHRIFKCLRCYRFTAKPVQPIMSDLPARRVSQERPFLHVGLDFGGPFHIKESNRKNSRTYKGYLALFCCLVTRSLHLDVCTELTGVGFRACLDRFISRRGLPHSISSDNGTNFVATARELKEVYTALRQHDDEISNALSARQIRWNFNCPAASNFGGIWEAGIKSVKYLLRRSVGEQPLSLPEFYTLICRCEAILNSRPLVDVSHDPLDGIDYLTPGHFLIGTSLLSAPEFDVSSTPMNRLDRWRLINKAAQTFWKVWSTSYLQSICPRSKWFRNNQTISKDDLVILPNTNRLPLHWPIGRVIEIYPGLDGVIRVAKIKLANTVLTRPVNKLIPLPQ